MVAVARIVVVHEGGTPWWVPLVIGLGVAVVAAAVSYAATWRFKKRDVERENAFRAAERIDQAEQITARQDRYDAEGGAATVNRLVQEARVRAQPLGSSELDDRFQAAIDYLFTFTLWQPPPGPPGGRRWLGEGIANIREGLLPFLAAPRFLPVRRDRATRSFPTKAELLAMPRGANGQELIDALEEWKAAQEAQPEQPEQP
jgi:hypothetical protein